MNSWRTQDFGPKLNAFRDDALLVLTASECDAVDRCFKDQLYQYCTAWLITDVLRGGRYITVQHERTDILTLLVKHNLYTEIIARDCRKEIRADEYARVVLHWGQLQPAAFAATSFDFSYYNNALSVDELILAMRLFPFSLFYFTARFSRDEMMALVEAIPPTIGYLTGTTAMDKYIVTVRRRRLLALTVNVTDGYLRCSVSGDSPGQEARFLHIVSALPLELQHDICALVQGVLKPTWLSVETRDCEWAYNN